MAMSRMLSKYVTQRPHPKLLTTHLRHRSSKPLQAQLIEVDLDSSQPDAVEVIGGYRRLEEVLQSIIARRAAPDWLPFLPGYSYYVPPPPPLGHHSSLIEILGRLSSSQLSNSHLSSSQLSRDAFHMTNQGWPSSAYFIEATAPTHHPLGVPAHPPSMELVVVEVNVCDGEEAARESPSEDE